MAWYIHPPAVSWEQAGFGYRGICHFAPDSAHFERISGRAAPLSRDRSRNCSEAPALILCHFSINSSVTWPRLCLGKRGVNWPVAGKRYSGSSRNESEALKFPFEWNFAFSENLMWHLKLAMDPKGIAQEHQLLMVRASFPPRGITLPNLYCASGRMRGGSGGTLPSHL